MPVFYYYYYYYYFLEMKPLFGVARTSQPVPCLLLPIVSQSVAIYSKINNNNQFLFIYDFLLFFVYFYVTGIMRMRRRRYY